MATVVAKTFTRPTATGPYTWGNHPIPLWSDPNAWGGAVPADGADVTIPAGESRLLDGEYVVGRLHVNGDLHVKNTFQNVGLRLKDGHTHGVGQFLVASEAEPYTGRATFEFYGDPPASPPESAGHERGWMMMDSAKFKVFVAPKTPNTKLGAHASEGDTTFTLAAAPTNWKAGDRVVIGPTDFRDTPSGTCQVMTLAADVSGTSMTTVEELGAARWGVLQYATDTGWSLTAETFTYPGTTNSSNFPTVLDERAVVVNLSRGVEFSGADDEHWQTDAFGAHMMVMSRDVETIIDGARWTRAGQQGHMARYPIHWHLLSYDSTFISNAHLTSLGTAVTLSPPVGTTLVTLRAGAQALRYTTDGSTPTAGTGIEIPARAFALPITANLSQIKIIQQASGGDVWIEYHGGTGAYIADIPEGNALIKNCAFDDCSQRAVVVHGTCGVTVQNTVAYKIKGHAFFLEDGVERRNTFDGCVAMDCDYIPDGNLSSGYPRRLMPHEGEIFGGGPTGFWLTNPDNTVTNCISVGNRFNGFHWAMPTLPMGLSSKVVMHPLNIMLGTTTENTSGCHGDSGFQFANGAVDSIANIPIDLGTKYQPTDDELPGASLEDTVPFSWGRFTVFKVNDCYINRTTEPAYVESIFADSAGSGFTGATSRGTIQRTIMSGPTLNESARGLGVDPNTGYPMGPCGMASYHGTLMPLYCCWINLPSVAGRVTGAVRWNDLYLSPIELIPSGFVGAKFVNSGLGFRPKPAHLTGNDTLLGDGSTQSGWVWDEVGLWGTPLRANIYDASFLTHGAADLVSLGVGSGNSLTSTIYTGDGNYQTNRTVAPYYRFEEHIRIAKLDSSFVEQGVWEIPATPDGSVMRHFAAQREGIYVMTFPTDGAPTSFSGIMYQLLTTSDRYTRAMSFASAPTTVQLEGEAGGMTPIVVPLAADRAEVVASTTPKYWYDAANDLCWVKVVGGLAGQSTAENKNVRLIIAS